MVGLVWAWRPALWAGRRYTQSESIVHSHSAWPVLRADECDKSPSYKAAEACPAADSAVTNATMTR
jgi:hypothetical protein